MKSNLAFWYFNVSLAVDLWKEFLTFVLSELEGADSEDSDEMLDFWTEQVREAFKSGEDSIGRHFIHAEWFWIKYIQFADDFLESSVVPEVLAKALAIPMKDTGNLRKIYELWVEQNPNVSVSDTILSSIEKAESEVLSISTFENEIASAEMQNNSLHMLSSWKKYLIHALQYPHDKIYDKSFFVCIFERCIYVFFLYPEIWHAYIAFLQHIGLESRLTSVIERALKNCPLDSSLHIKNAEIIEILQGADQAIEATENGISKQFNSMNDYFCLFSHLLYTLFRKYGIQIASMSKPSSISTLDTQKIINVIERGMQFLEFADSLSEDAFTFVKLVTLTQNRVLKNFDSSISTWTLMIDLAVKGNDDAIAFRVLNGYVEFLKYEAPPESSSSLLQEFFHGFFKSRFKKLSTSLNLQMANIWQQLELEFGSRPAIVICQRNLILSRLRNDVFVSEAYQQASSDLVNEDSSVNKKRPRETCDSQNDSMSVDQKVEEDSKKHRIDRTPLKITGEIEPLTVFVLNLPLDADESDLRYIFAETGAKITDVRFPRGQRKGIAYVDLDSEDSVLKSIRQLDGSDFRGRIIRCVRSKPPVKQTSKLDESGQKVLPETVFIKGLPSEVSRAEIESNLRNFFAACGDIREVRFPFSEDESKRFYCFVDFSSEESAKKALTYDKSDFLGCAVRVQQARIYTRGQTKLDRHDESIRRKRGHQIGRSNISSRQIGTRAPEIRKIRLKPTFAQSKGESSKDTRTPADSESQTRSLSNADFRQFLQKK